MSRTTERWRSQEEGGLDISPLIDMTFILLIFFMVTTSFVKDLDLELLRPQAASGKPTSAQALRVALDRTGRVFVDGHAVSPWGVQERVRQLLGSRGLRSVLVVADRRTRTAQLVEAVDQCRRAGAREVAVAVEREQ